MRATVQTRSAKPFRRSVTAPEVPSGIDYGRRLEICWSRWVCNDVAIAEDCGMVEWCKRGGAACDTAFVLRAGPDYYFGYIYEELIAECTFRFMAYKKPGIDTSEMPAFEKD